MSDTVKLERQAWKAYFDHVSRQLEGSQVEIEIASLAIGNQLAAKWLPLFGITYDEKNDLLAVMAEGLDHMIRHPREVHAEREGVDLHSIHVTDGDGTSQLLRFRATPAPSPAQSQQ